MIARSSASDWRPIDPENLLVIELQGGGTVIIELAPDFAPVHVANIRRFARAGWWNEATIYRVQDNYVAQWGNGDAEVPLPAGVVAQPPAEYERAARRPRHPPARLSRQLCADGRPCRTAGRSATIPSAACAWLTHCYGMVGVGRDLAPVTGTGGELYAVIGHAPRHLDRNIANVGRVVEGIEPALRPPARHRQSRLLPGRARRDADPDRPHPARRRHARGRAARTSR